MRAVDVREVVREGRRLFYERDGMLTPIARIYNRVIPDELERHGIVLPFDYRDDLDVEWTGGPDWFFRISKFSHPVAAHPVGAADALPHDVAVAARRSRPAGCSSRCSRSPAAASSSRRPTSTSRRFPATNADLRPAGAHRRSRP